MFFIVLLWICERNSHLFVKLKAYHVPQSLYDSHKTNSSRSDETCNNLQRAEFERKQKK